MMNDKTYNIITMLGIMFFLLVSTGFFSIDAWLSWVLCIAAVVVAAIPKNKYPALTIKTRFASLATLGVLMVILLPIQWGQNA